MQKRRIKSYPISRKKQLESRICKMSFAVVYLNSKRQTKDKVLAWELEYFLVRQQSS